MTSVLNVDTIAAKDGTSPVELTKQSAAKAWTHYNQATPAISDSFNTSSLTDSGTGQGDLNWTNAMSNATYSSLGTSSVASSGTPASAVVMDDTGQSDNRTASKWYFQCAYTTTSSSYFDAPAQSATILGDLA